MKLVIIEGPDNTGKNTLIMSLLDRYKNIKVTHCSLPEGFNNSEKAYNQEMTFKRIANNIISDYTNNILDLTIHNRSWYGEYVYGPMYRKSDKEHIKEYINFIEDILINVLGEDNIYYIQLMSSSTKLLNKNDDGLSLSNADEGKIQDELNAFHEIFMESHIKNKYEIYINKDDEFRSREDILNDFNMIYND